MLRYTCARSNNKSLKPATIEYYFLSRARLARNFLLSRALAFKNNKTVYKVAGRRPEESGHERGRSRHGRSFFYINCVNNEISFLLLIIIILDCLKIKSLSNSRKAFDFL